MNKYENLMLCLRHDVLLSLYEKFYLKQNKMQ